MVLEWSECIVIVAVSRIVVVAIARVIVAVVVISSSFHARVVGVAIGFRFIPMSFILYKIVYFLNYTY